jgi:hypothetical protein
MKKLFLSFFIVVSSSLLVFGQQQQNKKGPGLPGNSADFKATYNPNVSARRPDVPFSLLKALNPTVASPEQTSSRALIAEQTIGRTTFDNQTNGSIMRRIVNTDGKLSVVWTFSNEESDSFPNRGVAYNYFDGTSWINMPAYDNLDQITKIEPEGTRTGFATILNIPGKGEVVIGHRTDIDALQFSANNGSGNQNWNSSALRDFPYLWPRLTNAGPDGKTIHLIGVSDQDTINGVDLFDGMFSALMYSRSLNGGDTWDKKNILLPGIDSTKFAGFGGDSYAIDARGNTVALVYGNLSTPVVMWKSTDNGETWNYQVIRDFPFVPWKDQSTDYNNDGDVNDVIVEVEIDTVFAENGNRPDYVVFNGNNLEVQSEGSRKYVVSGNDTLEVVNDQYIIVEELVSRNDTFQVLEDTYVVFPPEDTVFVENVNDRKFVIDGLDTLDVQFDEYVVRTSEVVENDTIDVTAGDSFRFITIEPGVTEEVIEETGRSYIVFNGDTFDLKDNLYVLFPGDSIIWDERPFTNDGSLEILIDNNDKVHVWYGNMRMSNDEEGDGALSYYPGTSGLMYWNENFEDGEEPRMISNLVDDDGNNVWDVLLRFDQLDGGGNPSTDPGPFPYGGGQGATTTPTVAIDSNGKMYLFYQAYKEGEQYYYIASNGSYGPSFRHIYVITSVDNGQTWSSEGEDKFPTDITLLEEAGFDSFTEYAFPSVAKVVDDNIHLTYMSDEAPGIFVNVRDENYHPLTNNRMVYLRLTPDLNVSTTEIEKQEAGIAAYPNPANNLVNVSLELTKPETVTIRVSNLLGKTVIAPERRALPAGKGILQLNTESLSAGIYLVSIEVGQKTYTSKVVLNK